MKVLFAVKNGLPINWTFMILEHMASHDEFASELPYSFFINNILTHFGVNLVKVILVPMTDWELTMKICNKKMGVEYNFRIKTIKYIDDEIENTLPPLVQQPPQQET